MMNYWLVKVCNSQDVTAIDDYGAICEKDPIDILDDDILYPLYEEHYFSYGDYDDGYTEEDCEEESWIENCYIETVKVENDEYFNDLTIIYDEREAR